MNQRKVSARYYLFEEVVEQTPGFANLRKRVAIDRLQLLAGLVWARAGPAAEGRREVTPATEEEDASPSVSEAVWMALMLLVIGL